MDAVEKGYLKNMYFGIAQDADATNLLEVSVSAQLWYTAVGKAPCKVHSMHHCDTTLCNKASRLSHL